MIVTSDQDWEKKMPDQEWQRIAAHFRGALLRHEPSSLPRVQDSFVTSLEDAVQEALEEKPIDFVELEEGRRDDADDFGSALILAGSLLYVVRVRAEAIHVVHIGAPVGGIYREDIQLADGEVVLTRVTYEHPRLAELSEAVGFVFTPSEAERYVTVRKCLRLWGRRGIRVWGTRT